MLIAEIGVEGWTVLIAAVCVGVGGIITNVVTLVLNYYQEQARIKREVETAAKVVETAAKVMDVKATLQAVTDDQNSKLNVIASDIHKVEKASNSMKDALVATTRTEAHAAGVKEEKERDKTV